MKMTEDSFGQEVVCVSQDGQVTIPQRFQENCGIDAPSDVLLYEEEERITVEPLPSIEDLHGIHAGEHEPCEVLTKVREQKEEEERADNLNS